MEKKINIAEILKDCPKGMELYSPLCGECYFDRLNMGTIICKKQNTQEIAFTSRGYYMLPVFDGCECLLFPSKDQRDWSKFQRPFNDGDIVFYNDTIAIFKEWDDETLFRTYVTKYLCCDSLIDMNVPLFGKSVRKEIRLATEEEKEKLFQAIKDNGYKWNEETKTLEELNKPKFDITTLVPFESKVLVRNSDNGFWQPTFWGIYEAEKANEHHYRNYLTTKGFSRHCIPYNDDTKHLLGTTNDCDEFYKTW